MHLPSSRVPRALAMLKRPRPWCWMVGGDGRWVGWTRPTGELEKNMAEGGSGGDVLAHVSTIRWDGFTRFLTKCFFLSKTIFISASILRFFPNFFGGRNNKMRREQRKVYR